MAHPYMLARARKLNGSVPAVPAVPEPTEEAQPVVTKPAKARVIWTNEEMMTLARAVRELRINDVSVTPLAAARIAMQRELPENRQRVLHQSRDVEDIVKLIRQIAQESKASLALIDDADAKAEAAEAGKPEPKPEPVTSKRHLVRWTMDERRVIALESKRLLGDFSDMKKLEAIRKAVEYALPKERQRGIDTFTQVEWIADEWKAIDEHERAEKQAREAREQALQAERAAEESRRAEVAARAEAEAAKAIDPATLPFETLIGAIGVKIAGMLMRSIGEHLQESIMERVNEAIGHLPAPLPDGVTRLHSAPRNRKPRVLIVGLLNQQEQDIAKAMGEVLALDFVKSEHAGTLEDKARNADLVVLMTKFISHKHHDIVHRVNEHIVYRNGGVTELKRWLTQWVNGEVITAAA